MDPKSFLEHGTYRPSSLQRITSLTEITAPVDWMLGEHLANPIGGKEKRYDLSDEGKYLLSPPRVLGWSTVRKSWCEFMVTEVQKTRSRNARIFEVELQLDSKVKRMIKALVEQHNRKDDKDDVANPDLIEGKGRGLVIMLHGRLPFHSPNRGNAKITKVLPALEKQLVFQPSSFLYASCNKLR